MHRYFHYALYINAVRECYEAYVIWNFFFFLVKYVGDDEERLGAIAAGTLRCSQRLVPHRGSRRTP